MAQASPGLFPHERWPGWAPWKAAAGPSGKGAVAPGTPASPRLCSPRRWPRIHKPPSARQWTAQALGPRGHWGALLHPQPHPWALAEFLSHPGWKLSQGHPESPSSPSPAMDRRSRLPLGHARQHPQNTRTGLALCGFPNPGDHAAPTFQVTWPQRRSPSSTGPASTPSPTATL